MEIFLNKIKAFYDKVTELMLDGRINGKELSEIKTKRIGFKTTNYIAILDPLTEKLVVFKTAQFSSKKYETFITLLKTQATLGQCFTHADIKIIPNSRKVLIVNEKRIKNPDKEYYKEIRKILRADIEKAKELIAKFKAIGYTMLSASDYEDISDDYQDALEENWARQEIEQEYKQLTGRSIYLDL